MRLITSVLLCCITAALHAQQPARLRPQFFSTNQAVHIEGAKGSAFGVETVNGVKLGKWGAGIGAGIDRYGARSLPLFLHLRRQVPFAKIPLYLYADGGRNFMWNDRLPATWGTPPKQLHGLYWGGGLQYQLVLRGRSALVFSAGYGEKTFTEEQVSVLWCAIGPCPEQKNVWEHRYRRILLKAGFQL